MRSLVSLVFAALLLGAAPAPAAAEEPAPPPADTADVVAAYDAAFQALVAGDFDRAMAGFRHVAEVSTDPDRRAAARELGRLAEALKARALPATRPAAGGAGVRDASGRSEFIVSTTLASFYSGFVLVDIFDIDDYRPGVLMVSGATAAGFVGSLFGSRRLAISGGMAESYTAGLFLGLSNGLLLGPILGVDVEGDDGDGEVAESWLELGLGATIVGGAAALYLADQVKPTRGQAMMVNTLAVAGIATVGLGYGIFQPEEVDYETVLLTLALGLDAGAGVAIALAPRIDWSTARVRLVSLSGFLGAVAGFTVGAVVIGEPDTDEDARFYATSVLLAGWGGLGLGTYLTRDMPPDPRFAKPETASTTLQVVPFGRGVALAGTF